MHELTRLREKRGMSMRQLAQAARISHSVISRTEAGMTVPTRAVAMALAAELGARTARSQKLWAMAIMTGEAHG